MYVLEVLVKVAIVLFIPFSVIMAASAINKWLIVRGRRKEDLRHLGSFAKLFTPWPRDWSPVLKGGHKRIGYLGMRHEGYLRGCNCSGCVKWRGYILTSVEEALMKD